MLAHFISLPASGLFTVTIPYFFNKDKTKFRSEVRIVLYVNKTIRVMHSVVTVN